MAQPSLGARGFVEQEIAILPPGASHLSEAMDRDGNHHYLYLISDTGAVFDPKKEGLAANYTLVHTSFNSLTKEFLHENISNNVFAYHYTLAIDTNNVIHTAYVANNRTLYYGHNNGSRWNIEALTNPLFEGNTPGLWAFCPSIALDASDEPRIVFAASFNDLSTANISMQGAMTVYYTAHIDSNWQVHDILNNSNRDDFLGKEFIAPNYPDIHVSAQSEILISWINSNSILGRNELHYTLLSSGEDVLPIFTTIVETTSLYSQFRRANIAVHEQSVFLSYGSTRNGAARLAYLGNYGFAGDWEIIGLDTDRNYRPAFSTNILISNDLQLYVTWSLFDGESLESERFEHDVYLASLDLQKLVEDGLDAGNLEVSRITFSDNIEHRYPTLGQFSNTLQISYIVKNGTGISLRYSYEDTRQEYTSGAGYGFLLGIALIAVFVTLYYWILRKIPPVREKND